MTEIAALVARLDTLTVTAARNYYAGRAIAHEVCKKQIHTLNAQLGALLKESETES